MALVGCANPLSNEAFYADDSFLAALPDADRIGFSTTFTRFPREGTDPLLLAMADEAESIEPFLTLIIGVTGVLAQAEPNERDVTLRHWNARAVSTPPGSGPDLWFLRADIARTNTTADFDWQIEAALEEDGDWLVLASGEHDPEEQGEFEWDLEAAGGLLDLDLGGPLSADYRGRGPEREVDFRIQQNLLSVRDYTFIGDNVFGWSGDVWLHEMRRPGTMRAYLQGSGAGRAQAEVYDTETPELQESCWNATGDTQYARGTDLGEVGIATDCTTPDPF